MSKEKDGFSGAQTLKISITFVDVEKPKKRQHELDGLLDHSQII